MTQALSKLVAALNALERSLLHAKQLRSESGDAAWHESLSSERQKAREALDALRDEVRETQINRLSRLLKGCSVLRKDADPRVCEQLGREALAIRMAIGGDSGESPTHRVQRHPKGALSTRSQQAAEVRAQREPDADAPAASAGVSEESGSRPIQNLVFEDFSLERARKRRKRPSRRRPATNEPEWSLVRAPEPKTDSSASRGLSWKLVTLISFALVLAGGVMFTAAILSDSGSQAGGTGDSNRAKDKESRGDAIDPSRTGKPAGKDGSSGGAASKGGSAEISSSAQDVPGLMVILIPAPGDSAISLKDALLNGSPFHALDAMDARYGNPQGRERMNQLLSNASAMNANWRKTGTLRALLSSLRKQSGLLVYQQSPQILPSEVIANEGGQPLALALTWYAMARRLGLSADGFVAEQGEEQAYYPLLSSGALFWGREVELKDSLSFDAQAVLMQASEALLQRELAKPAEAMRHDLADLIDLLAYEKGDASVQPYRAAYAQSLLPLVQTDGMEQLATSLRSLLAHLQPEDLSREALLHAIAVLGDNAEVKWFARADEWMPEHVLEGEGMSVAERFARALTSQRPPVKGDSDAWRGLVESRITLALKLTPERADHLQSLAREAGLKEPDLFVARAQYRNGHVTPEVAAELAALAEREEQPLKALALLQSYLLSVEALSPEDKPLLFRAIVLALNLNLPDEANTLLVKGLEHWPQDPLLLRLDAESLIAERRLEEGVRLLQRYVRAWPEDQAARERLKSLGAAE